MAARLGRILYWAACGLAALIVIGGAFGLRWEATGPGIIAGIGLLVIAGLIWIIGRGLKYVLANE